MSFICIANTVINLAEVESFTEEFETRNGGEQFPVITVRYKSGRYKGIRYDLESLLEILRGIRL